MKPCVIDTRITVEIPDEGLHLLYPLGRFDTFTYPNQRIEYELMHREGLIIDLDGFGTGHSLLMDQSMCPLYKFVTPSEPSKEYKEYEFYSHGRTYIFEIRIDCWIGN